MQPRCVGLNFCNSFCLERAAVKSGKHTSQTCVLGAPGVPEDAPTEPQGHDTPMGGQWAANGPIRNLRGAARGTCTWRVCHVPFYPPQQGPLGHHLPSAHILPESRDKDPARPQTPELMIEVVSVHTASLQGLASHGSAGWCLEIQQVLWAGDFWPRPSRRGPQCLWLQVSDSACDAGSFPSHL